MMAAPRVFDEWIQLQINAVKSMGGGYRKKIYLSKPFFYAKWVFGPKHSDMLILSYISKNFVIDSHEKYIHEIYSTPSFEIITLTYIWSIYIYLME